MRKKRPPYARSSRNLDSPRAGAPWRLVLIAVALAGSLSGCAGRPWSNALEGERLDQSREALTHIAGETRRCGESLDGDLALFYSDPLEKKALSGYLMFSHPGSYKFVVANPLGQTILAIAGDRKAYQSVNVVERLYVEGSVHAFGLRHGLPEEFLSGAWGDWLTGSSDRGSDAITAIREDKDGRGLWVSYGHGRQEPPGTTHLLWDLESKTILQAMLENGDGRIIAEISYQERMGPEVCRQPQEVHITGLDYGTDIRLRLSNIEFKAERKRYRLPIPNGYQQQYLP